MEPKKSGGRVFLAIFVTLLVWSITGEITQNYESAHLAAILTMGGFIMNEVTKR